MGFKIFFMDASNKVPEVYIEGVPLFPPSIQPVETAIPVFIGYTEKAMGMDGRNRKLIPQRITSLFEYETCFGGAEVEKAIAVTLTEAVDAWGQLQQLTATAAFVPPGSSRHNLYYAIQLFYANGGGPCYVISVGLYSETNFGQRLDVTPFQDGLQVMATLAEPTLVAFPEGQHIDTAENYYRLQDATLEHCATAGNRFALIEVYETGAHITQTMESFRNGIGNSHLDYGAAYFPNLVTTFQPNYAEADVVISHVQIVNGILSAAAPLDKLRLSDERLKQGPYYVRAKEAIKKLNVVMPPGAAVAGAITQVDNNRGVWKAPANVSLNSVKAPALMISDRDQELMNVDPQSGKSVNAIRAFTGKGVLVWGARTLAGNNNEWHYIPVRRFMSMVVASVRTALMPFTVEPNEMATWFKVRVMIENFLAQQWKQGALQGAKPEEAFYVKVGLNQTMTAQDVADGVMIIEIGMAVLRPAEFILLRINQKMQTTG